MDQITDWAEITAMRMMETYNRYLQIGASHIDAKGQVLENTVAGPRSKAIFLAKVAPMGCQVCGVETIDVSMRDDGRQLCDYCL